MSVGEPTYEPAEGQRHRIGRYVLIAEIGTGAMGVVLSAYDPDLDRKVALKVLRDGMKGGSHGPLRMRREAQAMAKLSHPNVAQVYEVAEAHGHLYLAMEFINGSTLRDWQARGPRRWQEVLRVYIEAGRGLAAAHGAGILHRDFKPDNAMIDGAGRVRVLDFGLSRAEPTGEADPSSSADAMTVTAAGSLIGTPAYMSPEQHRREAADARSDQFSFCVALWEALHGMRPFAGASREEIARNVNRGKLDEQARSSEVPPWISRSLERGLAADPAQRWPSMEALLTALAHDPRRTRRRWLAAIGAVAAVAGAGYGLAVYQVAQAQVCSGGADDLRGIWDGPRRDALARTIAAIEVPYAGRALAATVGHLDAYAERWVSAQRGSCEAHRRGQLSPGLFDRRMSCLRQRKAELAATVEVLGQTTRESVANVVDTANGLRTIAGCEDDERLLADVPLPSEPERAAAVEAARERLARGQALERSGRYTEGIAAVKPMLVEADVLGYLPHTAAVHLLAGRLYMHTAQASQSFAHLDLALRRGLEGKVDEVAAEAAGAEVFVFAELASRPAEALTKIPLAWSLVHRAGDVPRLAALLHNNVGVTRGALGEKAQAITEYEQCIALLANHSPDDPLRWAAINNMALVYNEMGQYERARTIARDGLVQLESRFDACYPVAAGLRAVIAASEVAIGDFPAARADLERSITCYGEDFPYHVIDAIAQLGELAWLLDDDAEARLQVEYGMAMAARHPEHAGSTSRLDLLRVDLDVRSGALADAAAMLADLLARAEAGEGAESLQRFSIHTRLGLLAHLGRDDAGALEQIERATRTLTPSTNAVERGLHAFTHARVLHALGREPREVMAEVRRAIDSYRAAGPGFAVCVREVEGWLAARPELGGL